MSDTTDSTDASGTTDSDDSADATDTADSDDSLVVYSDYVCPFCYLGKAALEQYLDDTEDPPNVDWQPFDLRGHKRRPDGSIAEDIEDGKDEDYFEQVRENVDRLRDQYDTEMLSIDETPDVDSWNAQVVSLAARRQVDEATFQRLHDALFEALWVDGRDIGDPDVLRDVVDSVGIDPSLVEESIEDDALEAELEERFESARREGVSAVPTFVYGEYAARGAVPPTQLRRLVEGV